MTEPRLFPKTYACVSCNAVARERERREDRVVMVGINFSIYRRGQGKRQLKYGGQIHICDTCLIRALDSQGFFVNKESGRLMAAFRAAISGRYNAILEDDRNELKDLAKPEGEMFRELFREPK